ncbi:MAG: DUF898 family protein [Devosia sp.]
MTDKGEDADVGSARFVAGRWPLFWLLLRGYLLMLPTLGIYRFWLTTQTRRFYWTNTLIGGEPLEYTGNALQLLVGFFFAVAFFLPLYIAFFYFATQGGDVAVIGYGVVGLLFWFMTGYALYRARDFRLSRTLWRGIRFDQRGSAWAYAGRRFLWSLVVIVTLGLAYPFMAASLWRYRWSHCFYGDRRFAFSGSWRTLAGPFYRLYFGLLILAVATFIIAVALEGRAWPWLVFGSLFLLFAFLGWYHYRARTLSRLYSCVSLGEARLDLRVRARILVGQVLAYGALALLWSILCFVGGIIVVILVLGEGAVASGLPDAGDLARLARTGWAEVALVIGSYLGFVGGLALLGEVVFGYGYWALLARGARVSGLESLASVRAATEDRSVVGEGLADALNIGAY